MSEVKRSKVFGMTFDFMDQDDLCEEIKKESDKYRYIVTPNVDHLVRLDRNPSLHYLYDSADYSVCDSRVVYLLSRFRRKNRIKEVVTGSDLTKHLMVNVITNEDPIIIIGCNDEVLANLKKRFPLKNVRHLNPPMGFVSKKSAIKEVVSFVKMEPAKFIFICVGSPQQEIVAKAIKESGYEYGVGLCVGASFLFLTGHEKRSPVWMQKISMEWLYRLITNPRRLLKRYLIDSWRIIPIFFSDFFKKN